MAAGGWGLGSDVTASRAGAVWASRLGHREGPDRAGIHGILAG